MAESQALAVIDAQFEAQASAESAAVEAYLAEGMVALQLVSSEDLQLGADVINELKDLKKKFEGIEKFLTEGAKETIARVKSLTRPKLERIEQARELWDEKIRAYHVLQAKTQATAEKALQKAIVEKDPAAATAAIQLYQAPVKVAGLSTSEVWDFEEINHDIVPASMTAVVPAAVRTEIKRQVADGVAQPAISGLRVFKKTVVTARG